MRKFFSFGSFSQTYWHPELIVIHVCHSTFEFPIKLQYFAEAAKKSTNDYRKGPPPPSTWIKADRPHPHDYLHTPTDYRHTNTSDWSCGCCPLLHLAKPSPLISIFGIWHWPLTYNPNLAKVKVILHTRYQHGRSNGSAMRLLTDWQTDIQRDRQRDSHYQFYYLPASLKQCGG